MIPYNPNFLDNTNIFTKDELNQLQILNSKVSLEHFLNNKSYIDKFGLDFIHTSALIEGNSYVNKYIPKRGRLYDIYPSWFNTPHSQKWGRV